MTVSRGPGKSGEEKKKSMKDTGEILNPSNLMGNGRIERKEGKKNQNSNPRGWCAVVIN